MHIGDVLGERRAPAREVRRDKLPAAMTLHEDIENATPAWSLRFALLVTVCTAVLVGFVGSCFLAILLWATDVQ